MPTQNRSARGKTVTEKAWQKVRQPKVARVELRARGGFHGLRSRVGVPVAKKSSPKTKKPPVRKNNNNNNQHHKNLLEVLSSKVPSLGVLLSLPKEVIRNRKRSKTTYIKK